MQAKVTVKGISGLLINRFVMPDFEVNNNVKKNASSDQSNPEICVPRALYKDRSGRLFLPQSWFFGAMRESASNFRLEGKGKSTIKSVIGGAIMIVERDIYFNEGYTMADVSTDPNNGDDKPITVDARPIVNPATKGRMVRYRPCVDQWSVTFTIEWDESVITSASAIKDLIEFAGQRIGVGDFRPKKMGPFGKFTVTAFEVLK